MAVLKNKIELRNLSKTYYLKDRAVEILKNLSFDVHENEFLVLLGPGRCGKTVLLNIIAELENRHQVLLSLTADAPRWEILEWYFRNMLFFLGKP